MPGPSLLRSILLDHERDPNLIVTAVLDQRVTGLESSVSGVKRDVADLSVAMSTMGNNLSKDIGTLGDKFSNSRQTNWPGLVGMAVGVASIAIAIIGGAGVLAKAPIDMAISRLDTDVRELYRNSVPRTEYEQRWSSESHELDRIREALREMRQDFYVPRGAASTYQRGDHS